MGDVTYAFKRHQLVHRIEEFNLDPPSTFTIWIRRHWTIDRWVYRERVPPRVIRAHMRRLRFVLGAHGLEEAPCRTCGTRTPMELLSSVQLCDACGAGTPETICRVERQGRVERVSLRRPYSPGVSRKPIPISAVLGGP